MAKIDAITGVSKAINQTMNSYQKGQTLVEKSNHPEFTIKIANTLDERAAAFSLGYQIYLEKGFIGESKNEWLIRNYDANPDTVILIVQDQEKNIAGSATIVFNGSAKLPAEKIYGEELKSIKKSGANIAELSRLVINHDYRNAKEILVLLFNYSAIYIHQVKKYDGLVIQVNPRHKNYYKSLLNFDEIGSQKPCPNVQNAPANLLHISAKKYRSEIYRHANSKKIERTPRSLYPYFLNIEQENLVAYYLEKQHKPMTVSEKIYFGFSESNTKMALAF